MIVGRRTIKQWYRIREQEMNLVWVQYSIELYRTDHYPYRACIVVQIFWKKWIQYNECKIIKMINK